MASRKRVYVGPVCGVLLLANGVRVKEPEKVTGRAINKLIKQHPRLEKYYPLVADEEE